MSLDCCEFWNIVILENADSVGAEYSEKGQPAPLRDFSFFCFFFKTQTITDSV